MIFVDSTILDTALTISILSVTIQINDEGQSIVQVLNRLEKFAF
ncbi:hypothetical protein ADIARSV_2968 [Arcticibacter svalbardensis MN12-7]|uniref:Uncharacterized protein n=1 Tax=Arcticibacter svalbardensis MN12-7 TaxID=1150600 RepID=R9GQ36_9SPHI|nr:hypothetical protein ADIARSV_2968 [Arcticibacter svalbardensis MN12-7]